MEEHCQKNLPKVGKFQTIRSHENHLDAQIGVAKSQVEKVLTVQIGQ